MDPNSDFSYFPPYGFKRQAVEGLFSQPTMASMLGQPGPNQAPQNVEPHLYSPSSIAGLPSTSWNSSGATIIPKFNDRVALDPYLAENKRYSLAQSSLSGSDHPSNDTSSNFFSIDNLDDSFIPNPHANDTGWTVINVPDNSRQLDFAGHAIGSEWLGVGAQSHAAGKAASHVGQFHGQTSESVPPEGAVTADHNINSKLIGAHMTEHDRVKVDWNELLDFSGSQMSPFSVFPDIDLFSFVPDHTLISQPTRRIPEHAGDNPANVFIYGASRWNPSDPVTDTSLANNVVQQQPTQRSFGTAEDSIGQKIPSTLLYQDLLSDLISNASSSSHLKNSDQEKISQNVLQSNIPKPESPIGSFDSNQRSRPGKRKREAFNPDKRQKVGEVRKKGACICCRARKVSCSTNEVCDPCLGLAGYRRIAKQICLRDKMGEIYISVNNIHGSLNDRKERLVPILESLIDLPRTVFLTVPCETGSAPKGLQLQVRQCTFSPYCRWKQLGKVKDIYITCHTIFDKRYVIVESSLPSLRAFDAFGREILSMSEGSYSGRITRLLDDFLIYYSAQNQRSELRDLANLTTRIASLNGLVAYGFVNLHDGCYHLLGRATLQGASDQRFVSETVHDQIRLLAAKGLEPAEAFVFAKLDNLAKYFGNGKHSRIVTGLCILRLAFMYRDRLVRDHIRLGLPGGGDRHQDRLKKAAFMYRRLIVAFRTLCGESSTPLTLPWEGEVGMQDTESDDWLRTMFLQLQSAFTDLGNGILTPEYDEILLNLLEKPQKVQENGKTNR